MDFIYGEISQKALKNTYTGGSTSSAEVVVDNSENKIYVYAKYDANLVKQAVEEYLKDLKQVTMIACTNTQGILEIESDYNIISCLLGNRHIEYIIASGSPSINVFVTDENGIREECLWSEEINAYKPKEDKKYGKVEVQVIGKDKVTLGPLYVFGY